MVPALVLVVQLGVAGVAVLAGGGVGGRDGWGARCSGGQGGAGGAGYHWARQDSSSSSAVGGT